MPDNVNSYFGNIGNTFYAGPNGASFSISKTYANHALMVSQSEAANILVGEYVAIDYGIPGSDSYNTNKAADSPNYYNGTLYQKTDSSTFTRIFQITPYGPNITFSGSTPLAPGTSSFDGFISKDDDNSDPFNQSFTVHPIGAWDISVGASLSGVTPLSSPTATIDTSGPNPSTTKYIHFGIPPAWDIEKGQDIIVTPDNDPSVSIDRKEDSSSSDSSTTKYIHFGIPKPWDLEKGQDITITSNDPPQILINKKQEYQNGDQASSSDNNNTTTKYIHFGIPPAWNIVVGNTSFIQPDENPEVTITSLNNTKQLNFKFPIGQKFTNDAFSIVKLGPSEDPYVRVWFNGSDSLYQYPKVELQLPRAEKTKYGSAMAYTSNMTISISGVTAADWEAISELSVGDFYINTTYAAIHKITSKTSDQATTSYLGNMQLVIPTISAKGINPYDESGNPVTPSITTEAVGPVATWTVNVETIKAPVFRKSADSGFVAPTATGVISSVAANDGVTYTIKVPRGARINTNTEATISQIVNPLDGDINIDENGGLRQYNGNLGQWSLQTSIKGNNFLIKNRSVIIITVADIVNYTGTLYQKMGQYVADNFSADYSTNLKANEILNIEYQPEQNVSASHWLYKANGEWAGSKLTGDVSNTIVENIWQDESEDNKAYSVTRINELRSTITTLQTKITAIEAAIEAAWGELPIIE